MAKLYIRPTQQRHRIWIFVKDVVKRAYRRTRRTGGSVRIRIVHRIRPPEVSIVVPVYNVEQYLETCLKSLLKQSFGDIEIIIINDGSTDKSSEIALAMRRMHRHKIRYFSQLNAGLGAARNAGVQRARGRYLMFVDSDDTLPPGAVTTMVSVLRRTGSDFVCGAMERVENGVKRLPKWVKEVHANEDLKTTIWQRPDLIVDVFACNKLFSMEFWRKGELEFPVGIYYEDQILSVKTYLASTSFDVISEIVYQWRIRIGSQSITQTTADIKNLHDRIYVTHVVNDILLKQGTTELRRHWLDNRILDNDISLYLKDVDLVTDEYYSEIRRWMSGLFAEEDWEFDFQTSPMKRLLAWSVVHLDRRSVEQLCELDRANTGGMPTRLDGAQVWLDPPQQDLAAFSAAPSKLFRFADKKLELVSSLRNINWSSPTVLELGGWAFISHLDLATHQTTITIELHSFEGEFIADYATEVEPAYRVTRRGSNRWLNYDPAGFRVSIDLDPYFADGHEVPKGFQVWVRVQTSGFERVGPIRTAVANGGVKWPIGSSLFRGHRLEPVWQQGVLYVEARTPAVQVNRIYADADDLVLECSSAEALDRLYLTKRLKSELLRLDAEIEPRSSGEYQVRLKTAQHFITDGRERKLRAEAPGRGLISMSNQLPDLIDLGNITVIRSPAGNLILDRARPRIVIDHDELAGSAWSLTGTCVHADVQALVLAGQRHQLSPQRVRVEDSGRFEVTFDLLAAEWGYESRRLPAGLYQLRSRSVFDEGQDAQVTWGLRGLRRVPREFVDSHYSVRSTKDRLPVLEVLPDIGGEGTSPFYQRQLQAELYEPAREMDREPAVLFESFHGRNVTCNPMAIWRELSERESDLKMYWSINDSSVWTPPGTIPVVRLSADWYKVLGRAKFLVNNSNFPSFFQQADDQVYLQTWHGTPLKKIGHDISRILFSYRNYLDLMDREAGRWNALISPNGFCTELFPHAFGFDGRILETGYPRNDQLINDPKAAAARARRLLGLEFEHRKILLYAPTWRDDEFVGRPGRYRAVYYLDFEAFNESLSDEYMILVRGHSNTLLYGRGVGGESVIDVTRYPEVAELYTIADVLVTDYSSVMFDFSVTKKPMIFLAPDIADYRDRVRGFYFDFEAESPGPILATTEELVESLRHLSQVEVDYQLRYQQFRERFNSLEDGKASVRVVDHIFDFPVGSMPRGATPEAIRDAGQGCASA